MQWRTEMHTGSWSERQRARDHYETLELCRRMISGWILGWDDMDWTDLTQDRDHWRALMNTVMNIRGSIKRREVPE
jgi:hypothetical protein